MSGFDLRPHRADDLPAPGSVPVSVVVLAKDETVNIERCLSSLAWAEQVVVVLAAPEHDAHVQRIRLMFLGRWIRHCGWYGGAWITRLMRRSAARFSGDAFGERVRVTGRVGRLRHDVVDQDGKGLASWLRKHVGYAELEAARRGQPLSFAARWRLFQLARATDTRPLPRAVAKDLVFPTYPARPLLLFCYMYLFRLGFLDGLAGLRFYLFHAWFQLTVDALRAESRSTRQPDLAQDGGHRRVEGGTR